MPFEDQAPEKTRRMSRAPQVAEDVPLSLSDSNGHRLLGKDLLQDILDRTSVPASKSR